jgi:hypothetical protein
VGGSVEGGDGLHLPVKAVDEHLARRVLTGETGRVLDRVVELRVDVELLSTPTAQPRAVFLFDDPKEERSHASNCRRQQPNNSGPDVLTMAPSVTDQGHIDDGCDAHARPLIYTSHLADPAVSRLLGPGALLDGVCREHREGEADGDHHNDDDHLKSNLQSLRVGLAITSVLIRSSPSREETCRIPAS